jgi:hypothetical protein
MAARTPNFFIAGAAKSGTTAVARYLEEHPQVYMSPIKEPSYFARDIIPSLQPSNWARNQRGLARYLNGPMRDRRGGCVLDWESYLKLFGNVTGEKAIGEASTVYLISPRAPLDIRAAIPDARIIIMLRSHVERAVSTYLMFCRNGRLRATFSEIIRAEGTGGLAKWRRMILETRKIAPGVERFLETFRRDQIRWYFHEDFAACPLDVMRSIYEFLGVDPDFQPDVTRRHNEGLLPRAPLLHRLSQITGLLDLANRFAPLNARPLLRRAFYRANPNPRISVEDRALLVEHFREDVERLSHLVERDLSHWLRLD